MGSVGKLLSRKEIAAMLKIGLRTLDQMRSVEQFPPPDLKFGKNLRWKESTLEQWMKRNRKRG